MSPYIDQSRRKPLDDGSDQPEHAGELTYRLTKIIEEYRLCHGTSFQTFAEILGALEATKLELYARRVRPYEQKKMVASGDVYLP